MIETQTAQSQAFHHRATFTWRAFLSHSGMSGYGQQNRLSLSSWFLRGRDSGMDHVPGLGPVRAASLEGFVGDVTRRCLRRSELRLGKRMHVNRRRTTHQRSMRCRTSARTTSPARAVESVACPISS